MIDKEQAFSLLRQALAASGADMTEAVIKQERLTLSRFAESRITDNIDKEETTLYIRAIRDKKLGVVSTGDLSPEGIKKAAADCEEIIQYIPADDKLPEFPAGDPVSMTENQAAPGTSNFGPEKRAEAIETIARIGQKGNLEASGAYRIEHLAVAVQNSRGMERYFTGNNAQLSLTLSGKEKNSGWSQAFNRDASQIDVSRLALAASQKAMLSREPVTLPDDKYTVILEPAAVGQLLLMLSFMGFGGKTFSQRRSFMSGKIGEKMAGDNFNVEENPLDPDLGMMPFDYEGIPRKQVPLISNGIARGVVHDSYSAGLVGESSTGHALEPTNAYGPYPKALSVAAGTRRLEEMIKSVERGVLITHFWYINFLNPMRTQITGTTADGTFLIEKGEIAGAIKNMRTNQSLLEAFSSIELLSAERIVYPQYSVLMKVPAMKINNFDLVAEEEDNSKC